MFERTVKAAVKSKAVGWEVIKNAAADCDRAKVEKWTAVATCEIMKTELAEADVHLELGSCKNRLGTALHWASALERDRRQFEKVAWSVVTVFWLAGYEPAATAAEIRAAGGKMTPGEARAIAFPGGSSGMPACLTDEKVAAAFATVDRAYIERDEGTYEPGEEVAWLMDIHRPEGRDWDAVADKWAREAS